MTKRTQNPIDRRADLHSWVIVLVFLTLSLIVEGTTEQMEIARQGGPREPGSITAQWLYEASSHIALIAVAALIPIWLNRFPLSLSNWGRRLPNYAAAFLLFTVGHILLMVAMRHAVWPFIAQGHYDFGLLRIEPWAYEMRKDLFTFLSMLGVFVTSRHIAVLDEERRAAREDAQMTGRLTLKSGGRQIFVPANEIVHASAAGNYVEVHTESGRHFVRLTLSELQTLLSEAGVEPVRLHRSHLTVRDHLRDVGPTDANLSTGVRLPVGRSYRTGLQTLG